jgi:hypothetical protein
MRSTAFLSCIALLCFSAVHSFGETVQPNGRIDPLIECGTPEDLGAILSSKPDRWA